MKFTNKLFCLVVVLCCIAAFGNIISTYAEGNGAVEIPQSEGGVMEFLQALVSIGIIVFLVWAIIVAPNKKKTSNERNHRESL